MNGKAILTACTIGAVLGAASYFLSSSPKPAVLLESEPHGMMPVDEADAMYWHRRSAQSYVAQYFKLSCRKLYGEHYRPDEAGNCQAPVDCTSCLTHKGVARNAVIHDNAWHPVKAAGPNYDALIWQDKLVFQMAMARQGEVEAGRRAYDHVVRCQRVWSAADVQCKN